MPFINRNKQLFFFIYLVRAINEVNAPRYIFALFKINKLAHSFARYAWLKYYHSDLPANTFQFQFESDSYLITALGLVEVQQLNDQLLLILISTPGPFCSRLNKPRINNNCNNGNNYDDLGLTVEPI